MIRPLRRVHRATMIVLALALPLLLALAIAGREPAAVQRPFPASITR